MTGIIGIERPCGIIEGEAAVARIFENGLNDLRRLRRINGQIKENPARNGYGHSPGAAAGIAAAVTAIVAATGIAAAVTGAVTGAVPEIIATTTVFVQNDGIGSIPAAGITAAALTAGTAEQNVEKASAGITRIAAAGIAGVTAITSITASIAHKSKFLLCI